MDHNITKQFVERFWDDNAVPKLAEFIRIPSKNQAFDEKWEENGYLEAAANLVAHWIKSLHIPGTETDVVSLAGRTPLLFVDIPGSSDIDKTIVFYGHLDKMPESEGWSDGKGPWQPVLEDDRLYGRGAADDGSSVFIAMAAIKALYEQSLPRARCVFLLETSEENGSPDFGAYLEHLVGAIGNPDLVICLDSGGNNTDSLWVTNSLRGNFIASLRVEMLTRGIHSGSNGGMVASTFRIMRQLLSRVEDEQTGKIILPELQLPVPKEWETELSNTAQLLGDTVYSSLPLIPGCHPVSANPEELLRNATWGSALSVIGAAGLPAIEHAGNVIRPATTLQLNFRIPPHAEPEKIVTALKRTFESEPPYGAKISFNAKAITKGWSLNGLSPWLKQAIADGSTIYFGSKPVYKGEGGAIGIIPMLAAKFPQAQIVITGALSSKCNAHGPDEYLDIPLAKKTSCAIAHIVLQHAKN